MMNVLDTERFISLYENPEVTVDDLCRIFKYAPGSIYRMGFELGLKRPKAKGQQLNLRQVRKYIEAVSRELEPLPRILEFKYRPLDNNYHFILLQSDEHVGRETVSFNSKVYINRMKALACRVLSLVSMFTRDGMTSKLHLFRLGDTVTGEKIGANITLEELEHTILQQVYELAVPYTADFILEMLNSFDTVEVDCVPGNHGTLDRHQASAGANWDNVVNLTLQAKLANYSEISFNIKPSEWYNYTTVKNTEWLLLHGDQFSGGGNYTSIVSGVTQWKTTMPYFDYVAMAHFHHFCKIRNIIMNGCLLSDDSWSKEVVKRDAEPTQVLIAVDDNGISDIMPIDLSDVGEDYDGERLA